jgi:hypothetical protein
VPVRATDILTITGLGDRPITPPAPEPPVLVTPRETLTMTGLGDRVIAPPPPEPEVRIGPAQIPPLRMTGVHGR